MNRAHAWTSLSFVADGYWRAQTGAREWIRPLVRARYADRLATAGWLKRLWLSWRIDREIAARAKEVTSPREALY